MYVVGYLKGVFRVLPRIPNREVKPLIVAVCVGVVLHEESVVVRCVFVEEGALEVAALETRIEGEMAGREGFLVDGFVVEVFEGFKVVIFVMLARL